ncbi:ribose transport system permease protein [Bradyrhizobium ottawaense]
MPDNGASQAKPAPATTNGAAAESKRQRVRVLISALGMLPVLLILCIGFHFLSEGRFFTGQNLGIVLQQAAVNTVLAAGMTFVILTGGIDLSVGSILAASAMAGLTLSKMPELGMLWLPAALLTGLGFGVVNGALIALLRLPPFIVTLGSLTAVRGLARLLGADTTVFNPSIPYAFIGNGSLTLIPGVASIPWLSVIALLVILVSWLVLRRTVLGVHIYAVGGNESAARLAGIKVWGVLIFVYGVSGLFAGLGGAMQAARLYAANAPAARPVLRTRRDHRRDPRRHLLRRRHRLDLGHAGRRVDHRRAVERPDPRRRLRHLAICHQGPGDHRRRGARSLPAAGLRQNLKGSART